MRRPSSEQRFLGSMPPPLGSGDPAAQLEGDKYLIVNAVLPSLEIFAP
jgi:hypothetical protein